MMCCLQKFLLALLCYVLIISYTSSMKLEKNLRTFKKEKMLLENKMNSMRLGNYLRKLMMKVNFLYSLILIIYFFNL